MVAPRPPIRSRGAKYNVFFPLFLLKRHGNAVHAVPQAGWFRTVFKNMTQMPTANATNNLCTYHAVAFVNDFFHSVFGNRFVKAGPAGAGVKLVV